MKTLAHKGIVLFASILLTLSTPAFAITDTTPVPNEAPSDSTQIHPILETETGNTLHITITAPKIIPGISNPPLIGVNLNLGENLELGRPYVAASQAPEGCILKSDIKARFCVDPVFWPASLLGPPANDEIIYPGNQAIVRYDEDRISQAHILFPTDRFIQILEHLETQYGPPTEQELVKTHIPESEPVTNTVVRWKSAFDGRHRDLILEVRAHDDIRRPFPDSTHGFMWLYRDGADPVFRHLSVIDLMVLQKRQIGQWPYVERTGKKSEAR